MDRDLARPLHQRLSLAHDALEPYVGSTACSETQSSYAATALGECARLFLHLYQPPNRPTPLNELSYRNHIASSLVRFLTHRNRK
jgi:hypothetical protein